MATDSSRPQRVGGHHKHMARKHESREQREQPKFDRWLQEQCNSKALVTLFLSVAPMSLVASFAMPNFFEVRILTVDRYMVLVEFQGNSQSWWISKESIKGAAPALEND